MGRDGARARRRLPALRIPGFRLCEPGGEPPALHHGDRGRRWSPVQLLAREGRVDDGERPVHHRERAETNGSASICYTVTSTVCHHGWRGNYGTAIANFM